MHIQSHIVVGRGLAREAAKRGIRIIGTNHFMPENMIEFTLLPKFLRRNRPSRLAWKMPRPHLRPGEAVTTPTRGRPTSSRSTPASRGVHAISCGIDAHNYTPDFAPRTENRILFVGRVTGEKQIDVLLKAIALLPDPALDAKLEIVGGGDQSRTCSSWPRRARHRRPRRRSSAT